MSVELRHLQTLVAVVEEGSFTAAADVLRMGQPAVSRNVAELERLLGVRLFDRTTRVIRLTEAGKRTHHAAVAALRAVAAVSDAAADHVRPPRLGYSWAALGRHTSAVLQAWRQRHPDRPLQVRRIDTRDAGLRRGLVDMAVIRGEFAEAGFDSDVLFAEPRVAAVPSGHRLAGQDRLALVDLVAELVVLTPSVGTTTAALWPGSGPPRIRTAHNLDEWLTAIAAGEGVGVTTVATAEGYPVPGVAYRPLTDAPDVPVRLVWPQISPHPGVAALAALIREIAHGPGE